MRSNEFASISATRAGVSVRTRESVCSAGAGRISFALAQRGSRLTAGFLLPAPVLLAIAGTLALASGMLVYLTARPAGHAALFPASVVAGAAPLLGTSLAAAVGSVFGQAAAQLGGWLPSFVHPFAFSLFSAAARPANAEPAYSACAAWWAVNVAFEIAQLPVVAGAVTRVLDAALGRNGLTRPLTSYLLRGTFDVGDLVAATAGALAAAGLLALVHRLGTRHAHD